MGSGGEELPGDSLRRGWHGPESPLARHGLDALRTEVPFRGRHDDVERHTDVLVGVSGFAGQHVNDAARRQ
jgi:hypothetical protein